MSEERREPRVESPERRWEYAAVAVVTLSLAMLGYVAAAFMPSVLGFELISRYGSAYAFCMYMVAITIPLMVQSAGILIIEFLARFRRNS